MVVPLQKVNAGFNHWQKKEGKGITNLETETFHELEKNPSGFEIFWG